ncbi:hypothetical protein PAAG_11384 [Paracoccidioides lutzii Pb01]|uniref:Uncharacterized protein n=1 Tax=Paracoccidioides lutzii (strain ATCC MYA-826 / Pb01) TaxID=502779 RepID=A0A0A2V644_PARBA|nr:hypothetical protein PAAG_11384 [Paracoccidioides lutzii Pb01]KGQ01812.1 hypothetical protein PAAG_11384 [Paracoccidioides lutzii Pb01]
MAIHVTEYWASDYFSKLEPFVGRSELVEKRSVMEESFLGEAGVVWESGSWESGTPTGNNDGNR